MTGEQRPQIGVTAARGFRASAVACGIRKKGNDVCVIVSDVPATAACVFTRNQVQAAPLAACRESLQASGGHARAIVVNAGNANACTGEQGLVAARRTAAEAARLLGLQAHEVLVASTGVIGQQLPVEKLLAGLPQAVADLSVAGGVAAAKAIMTTDIVAKEAGRVLVTRGGPVTIGGMAKGSGMIHPDMATTLAFVTTDAVVPEDMLARCLRRATDLTFNRISVDGDTSTNDMIAILANGATGTPIGEAEEPAFLETLTAMLLDLALMVARDGEGATKLVAVTVAGAETEAAALQVSRTIAGSLLVKTAIHGCDANWGRIVAAVGRSGIAIHPERLRVHLGHVEVLSPFYRSEWSEEAALRVLQGDTVPIVVDLGMGSEQATTWTCDLTKGYIDINASYRS
jgi:glutamate N-acetyltransferase/amino-acid N-acetyltransferase